MALASFVFNELLDNYYNKNLYDQHFGLGLMNDDVYHHYHPQQHHPSSIPTLSLPLRSGYLRPWRSIRSDQSGISLIKADKEGFKVNLDVQQFKPEELKVKIVDNYLVVEGKHEEKQDEHGYISRQFTRRYKIPENVDSALLTSKLSSDGVLMLYAPKKATETKTERSIPIVHTNTAALRDVSTSGKNSEKMEEN